jgi:hypothetical protein
MTECSASIGRCWMSIRRLLVILGRSKTQTALTPGLIYQRLLPSTRFVFKQSYSFVRGCRLDLILLMSSLEVEIQMVFSLYLLLRKLTGNYYRILLRLTSWRRYKKIWMRQKLFWYDTSLFRLSPCTLISIAISTEEMCCC